MRKKARAVRLLVPFAAAILMTVCPSPQSFAAQNGGPVAGKSGNPTSQAKQSPAATGQNTKSQAPAPEAQAQQPANSPQLDSALVLHHLDTSIGWYRSVTSSIQSSGLPTDAIYQDNAQTLAAEAVKLAFQSARAEASIIAEQQKMSPASASEQNTQQQNLAQMETRVTGQIAQFQSQLDGLNKKIAVAPSRNRQALISQRDGVQGQLELEKAVLDAVQKMASFADANGGNAGQGLQGSIEQLERSIPEVFGARAGQKPPAKASAAPAANSGSNGLVSQSISLYDEYSSIHAIDQVESQTQHAQAVIAQVRQPLVDTLRATIQAGRDMANQPPSTDPGQASEEQKQYAALTNRFKQISDAVLPLSQENIVLDESKTNLDEWSHSISTEAKRLLTSVLLRVGAILIALGVILGLSEFWRRLTFRYVRDTRRRRQFLVLRRVAVGFLIVIVLVLGFVSEFSSLATFAGFITAGIAVGLQAVLLSVAAYFFIIGRYGIRVGDRISVAGVTGDVVDIGLVRMYLMELAGTGVDLYPTGRIVVFSNSVLFQAGTPLYKQIPGTEYTWHEVAVNVSPNGDHKLAQEKLLSAVNSVFSQYRKEIERQHEAVERRIDVQMELPVPGSRLQFTDSGLEFLVRYPVEIRRASEIDDQITREVLAQIGSDPNLQSAVSGSPKIRAAVKG